MQRGRFNRRLFLARRRAENRLEDGETYIASLSSVTISYKGMIMPGALPEFYPDLRDPRLESIRSRATATGRRRARRISAPTNSMTSRI
jgi:glutamate synthase domain-containing protein 1